MLCVGDDWAEDHHDVEVQDETGRRLAKARLPEGISGIARLHALVGRFLPEDGNAAAVKIGIETDRGPWVAALVASGYQVYAVNPLQSARARQGNGVSGAKSDAGDAHVLADLVRTQGHRDHGCATRGAPYPAAAYCGRLRCDCPRPSRHDHAIFNNRAFFDGVHAENGALRWVDDWRGEQTAEYATVSDGKRATLQIFKLQTTFARLFGEGADVALDIGQAL